MSILQAALSMAIAYFIGSFSFGIFLSSLKGRDVRQEGSKSSGATNVTRVMGIHYGLLTFLGDFIKASLAVFIGRLIAQTSGAMLAGLAAVIGHNWPIYYGFKGGKGIVCSLSVLFWLFPFITLGASTLAIFVIAITKYVSLGSLVLLSASAFLVTITHSFWPEGAWSFILMMLAFYQHRTNIQRLLQGKENKFTLDKKSP